MIKPLLISIYATIFICGIFALIGAFKWHFLNERGKNVSLFFIATFFIALVSNLLFIIQVNNRVCLFAWDIILVLFFYSDFNKLLSIKHFDKIIWTGLVIITGLFISSIYGNKSTFYSHTVVCFALVLLNIWIVIKDFTLFNINWLIIILLEYCIFSFSYDFLRKNIDIFIFRNIAWSISYLVMALITYNKKIKLQSIL